MDYLQYLINMNFDLYVEYNYIIQLYMLMML